MKDIYLQRYIHRHIDRYTRAQHYSSIAVTIAMMMDDGHHDIEEEDEEEDDEDDG